MRPDARFVGQPKQFWACVRTLSQWLGYTERGQGKIRVPSIEDIRSAFSELSLNVSQIVDTKGKPTPLASNLHLYFRHRADVLYEAVEPNLMRLDRARKAFNQIRRARLHTCPMPMNKQKGKKKAVAFLTAIVNMLIEENLNVCPCCYDPSVVCHN